jgi:hypothetical protein
MDPDCDGTGYGCYFDAVLGVCTNCELTYDADYQRHLAAKNAREGNSHDSLRNG